MEVTPQLTRKQRFIVPAFCLSAALHVALLGQHFANLNDATRIYDAGAKNAIAARLIASDHPTLSTGEPKEELTSSAVRHFTDSHAMQQHPSGAPEISSQKSILGTSAPVLNYVKALEIDKVSQYENEGYVEAELVISLSGTVAKFDVLDSDLPTSFIEIISSAFQDASFQPALAAGVPVTGKYRFRAVFVNHDDDDISAKPAPSATGTSPLPPPLSVARLRHPSAP